MPHSYTDSDSETEKGLEDGSSDTFSDSEDDASSTGRRLRKKGETKTSKWKLDSDDSEDENLIQDEKPLQLVRFMKPINSKNKLNMTIVDETLEKVLKCVGDRPLCPIILIGPPGQGKSFAANFIMRKLLSMEEKTEEPDWIGWSDKQQPLTGFPWKVPDKLKSFQGDGIYIWQRPFIIDTQVGKVAVLLMECNGFQNDVLGSKEAQTSIFGLSFLMSSILVYTANACYVTNENFSNELFMPWIPYTKFGSKLSRDVEEKTPFQNISILIIDWSDSGKYCFGAKDGKKFLTEQVRGVSDDRARKYVQSSLKFFSMYDCFLLPPACEAFNEQGFDGSLQHLPSDFAKKLEKYVGNLISEATLPIKRIGNGNMNGNEFKVFLSSYLTLFNSYLQGREKLRGSTLYNTTNRTFNDSVIGKCIETYQSKFEWEKGQVCYLAADFLHAAHNNATKMALDKFSNSTMKAGDKSENKQRLTIQMMEAFARYQVENEKRRNNFINKCVLEATKHYEDGLSKKIIFQDELAFHDEVEIGEKEIIVSAEVTDVFTSKFNGESKESLVELNGNLKQELSPILDNLLHKNRQNKRQAECVMDSVVDNLLARYKKEMKDSIDCETPVLPLSLQAYHRVHKEKIIRKFKKRDLPSTPSFHMPYLNLLSKLIEDAFTAYASGEQSKIEVKNNQATLVEKNLRIQYQQQMDSFLSGNDVVSEEDLRSFHREVSAGSLREFKQKAPCIDGDMLGESYIKKFVDDLDKDFEQVLKRQIKAKKKKQKACENATTANLKQYIDDMEKEKTESGFIEENELNPTHERILRRALKTYDELTTDCNKEAFVAEQKTILQDKILEVFESFKTSNNLSKQKAESEAESLMKDFKKLYVDNMSLETLKTSDQLKQEHEKKLQETERAFSEMLGTKGKTFKGKWAERLVTAIDKKFSGLKREFEIKVAGEAVMFQNVIQRSRKFYHEQMKKECDNNQNINTTLLEALHFKVTQDAISTGSKGLQLTDEQRFQLMKSLEKSFTKYKMEYTMCSGGELAIGIDLGTTYCCVAVVQNKQVKIILNQDGELTTPSYIAFNENEDGTTDHVIGQTAKDEAYRYPENTIFDVKRIIGRRMDDAKLQSDIKFWPFKVIEHEGTPKIKICNIPHPPEQISAVLLSNLKEQVEDRLGQQVKKAVITVPAYFNDGQRAATKDAGEMAGFDVLTILNEPTAAAIAYKVKQFKESSRRVLVFDLGGGTFDVAVLDTSCDSIDVLGVGGDTHLGGEDFDKNLMEHCVKEFKKQTKVDLMYDKDSFDKPKRDAALRNLRRLQTSCEKAKRTLTNARQAKISIATFASGFDLNVTVTRQKFEELNMRLFHKTIGVVDSVLNSAKVSKDEVNDIVMIGGSTKIPKVKEMLRKHFNNMALDHSVNEDQAVAYGAAVQAALLAGPEGKRLFNFKSIRDVIPMSLGIDAKLDGVEGRFSMIIPKNTKFPHSVTRTYFTTDENQDHMKIRVYQGEDDIAKNNALLGEFTLRNIPLGKEGKEAIEVHMNVDEMGLIHVKATCKSTRTSNQITVTENRGRLTNTEKSKFMAKNVKPSKVVAKQQQATQLLNKLRHHYQQDLQKTLSSNDAVTREDLKILHINATSNILKEFQKKSQIHTGTVLGGQLSQSLINELESEFEAALIQWKRKIEPVCKHAESVSLQLYVDNMEDEKSEVGFIEENELIPTHDKYFASAVENYDKLTNVYKNEAVAAEERKVLGDNIHKTFEAFKVSNNITQQNLEIEAKSLMKEYKKVYAESMSLVGLKTGKELEKEHDSRLKHNMRTFIELLGGKGQAFRDKWANNLKTALNSKFADLKRDFETKVAKEEFELQQATQVARVYYHEEMKKECENSQILTTTVLEALHEKISKAAIVLGSKGFQMTDKSKLKELLEHSFIKYKMEYTMYSSGQNKEIAIGIDLGTTNCCVAVLQNKEVKIITNQDGEETTPSYIAFNKDELGIDHVIGQIAKDDAYSNPEHTIFDAKRIIGRKMNDLVLKDDMKFWPFKVVEHNGVPQVDIHGEPYPPEHISAILLSKLKAQVEEKIGQTVKKAVITVPAYFNDGQRLATKDAGEIAGFEVLTIINEPTAAAIAYKVKKFAETAKKVLVFDLGGGTFDVAVLETDCDSIVVLGVGGDTHLGGEDFDKNLMQYCVQEFEKEQGIDLLAEKDSSEKQNKDNARRTLRRLQTYCEKAKRALTSARQTKISVDNIVLGVDLHVTVTRENFEQLNLQLFQKTIDIVDDVLKSTKVDKDQINDIVLIGGSTKIPKVKQMLSKHFNNRALDHSINPDVAVAYGAAVQAALLNGAEGKKLFNFKSIQDVTPMSLGIEAVLNGISGRFSEIIAKNTKIPHNHSEMYYTVADNQKSMRISIYQGEDKCASNNKLLGEFTVDNIPAGKAGEQDVNVRMEINKMGILHVKAVCMSTNGSSEITVNEDKGRLTDVEKTKLKAEIAKPKKKPRNKKSKGGIMT